jgi:hypothetical protein
MLSVPLNVSVASVEDRETLLGPETLMLTVSLLSVALRVKLLGAPLRTIPIASGVSVTLRLTLNLAVILTERVSTASVALRLTLEITDTLAEAVSLASVALRLTLILPAVVGSISN